MDVNQLGNKIKKRRTALELTQKDLAKAMNVSNQLISKWETGESLPSLEYLGTLCKVLKVDFSYFTSEGEGDCGNGQFADAQPIEIQAAPPFAATKSIKSAKPATGKTFKFNLKLLIVIISAILAAAFIAGFTVLTIFVFVPSANRKRYLNDIEKSFENYFALEYYSIKETTELDGDVQDEYRYDGYLDKNGKPVFYDTKDKKVVKDDILTFDDDVYKYHYVPNKTYSTVEELAQSRIFADDEDEGLLDDDILDKMRYIRKVRSGYYLEMKDSYFLDELTGTQKKNTRLTDKIKGKIIIKDGLYNYMEITVKYLNKPDNERFTIKISYEFIAEKPVIEHKNLQEREWSGTYVGNVWYPAQSPDYPSPPDTDSVPLCEELLDTAEFVSRLSGGKAKKLAVDYDFNSLVLHGGIKNGGDCYYYVTENSVKILNKTNLSLKTTVKLGNEASNVYVYNGSVYYLGSDKYFYVKDIATGGETTQFRLSYVSSEGISYNGGYAIYYGEAPNTYTNAYNVIDLTKNRVTYSYYNIAYMFMDSAGNVYCVQEIDGKYIPVIYKNGNYTILKGNDYYHVNGWLITDGDKIFTSGNGTVYMYEKGELKEQLTTADPRLKTNYLKLSNGYCFTETTAGGKIFDNNGNEREFGTYKLKTENGAYVTQYGVGSISTAVGGKIICTTSYGYLVVFDENDLTKPLYHMKQPKDYWSDYGFTKMQIGANTIIAVRINNDDFEAYELYYY